MFRCIICRRDYASGASLRNHRSRFHRDQMSSETSKGSSDTQDDKNKPKNLDTESKTKFEPFDNWEVEMPYCYMCNKAFDDDSSLRNHRSRCHSSDPRDIVNKPKNPDTGKKRKNLGKKRKNPDTGKKRKNPDNGKKRKTKDPGFNPPKNHDEEISNIHDILKNLSEDKAFSFIDCYIIKYSLFDQLIPHIFGDETTMKEKLTQDQLIYATIVRGLQNLVDIHAVINEAKTLTILRDIIHLFTKN